MPGGKILVPLFLTALVVASSGCISDPTAFAKAIPMIQDFLDEYPNADISIVHYSELESRDILEQIREDCGKLTVEAKEYYFVNITDPSTGLVVRAWIDWKTQIIECVYKEGIVVDPENCTSLYRVECFGDHVFWFDSCGNREDKKEYCPLGCSDGRCIQGDVCDVEKSYTEKPDCACPDGYEMIVLYPACATPVSVAITDLPIAVTNEAVEKAVKIESGEVEISSDFTTQFNDRCADMKPIYRCVKRQHCKSHAQSKCYKGHIYWFDSCGHVQEKKQYCEQGCDLGFCKEKITCEQMGGYCIYPSVMCAQDAKECPDGSYVSRVPPECEFAHCPGEASSSSGGGGGSYATTTDSITGNVYEATATATPTAGSSDGGAGGYASTDTSTSSSGSGGSYSVCREGYQKANYWCPGNGVCCAPQKEKCAEEGEYTSGAISPEYYYSCCAGLKSFNPWPANWVGGGMLCYDPEKGIPVCDAVGTKSEGWYYPTGELLIFANCAEEVCRDENHDCYIGDMSCCAGLVEVPMAFEENGTCIAATCGSICRPCGNGVCDDNENKCSCPEDCAECTDSDGGNKPYIKGVVKVINENFIPNVVSYPDICWNYLNGTSYIAETYCDSAGNVQEERHLCQQGCEDGACVRVCTDSDGGMNYYEKGTLIGYADFAQDIVNVTECCVYDTGGLCYENAPNVNEYYCENNKYAVETYECPYGCENGTCIEAPECRDENYSCTIEDIPCCAGLVETGYATLDNQTCVQADCGTICVECGNGVCEDNENVCICPEDCV